MRYFGTTLYTLKDKEDANVYWRSIFSCHARQLPPLVPSCALSVVIPVYGERIDRLARQIASFARQTLAPQRMEIIYVVNNDLPHHTPAWKKVYRLNQRALTFLKKKYPFVVHAIDCSSPGREIPGCTVAKARTIGVAEASIRYAAQNRDGVLFHTDADVYIANKRLFSSVLRDFSLHPRAVGAAGGVIYEFNIDDERFLRGKDSYRLYQDIVLHFRWQSLLQAFRDPCPKIPVYPTFFSGAHMISRAIASACVGGVPLVHLAEDVSFGDCLHRFAQERAGYLLPRREKWYVVTALRESFRTDSSFGALFQNILEQGGVYAVHYAAPSFEDFVRRKVVELFSARSLLHIRKIVGDARSPFAYSDAVLADMQETLQLAGKSDAYEAYLAWREKKENASYKILARLYAVEYPRTKVTSSRLRELRSIVYKDSQKKAYAENVKKHWHTFRFGK